MSVSYDKKKREEATKKGHNLATVEVAGLTFQGPVTPAEQAEVLELYTKLNKRALAEATAAANAPATAPTPTTSNDPKV